MNILIIGNGGREHALAFKCAQSKNCTKVFVAPGNAGTHREPNTENVNIDVMDFEKLANFVIKEKISLSIVGPEAPLVHGIVDYFNERGLKILGPDRFAAQLEGSKSFAKNFMIENNIPTAKSESFTSVQEANIFLETQNFPVVIKADGLAAGKGVVIAKTLTEAKASVESMLEHKQFGDASESILIEEFLKGEEVSFIAICDGTNVIPLASSQDHKARDNFDKGPNTGGMGAYSPAPILDQYKHDQVMNQIINPALEAMKNMGHPFKGFLYAGLMINDDEINVLEFNTRFGDPETQPVLLRLKSDFLDLCLNAANQTLDQYTIEWDPRFSVGVVLASSGYPNKHSTGDNLNHLMDIPSHENYKIFHAGTSMNKGKIETSGGRVLCATALGKTLQEAHDKAYVLANKAKWDNSFFRTDIAHKAI
jgi:phosphoribosylamine--glycine ligase